MRKLLVILILAVMATIHLPSCVKDNFDFDKLSDNIQFDGSYALPLASSSIAFYQVLDFIDSTVGLIDNDEGYLSVYYHSQVESAPVKDLFEIGTQSYSTAIDLADFLSKGTKAETTYSYSHSENIAFDLFNTDAELDSIVLSAGAFEYSVRSGFGRGLRVILEFPSIRRNNKPLKDSIAFLSFDSQFTKSIDLGGYTIDLTTTERGFNEIPVNVTVVIQFDELAPPTSGQLAVDVALKDFSCKRLFGYFGYNELFFQSDTINIKLFKDNPKYYMERFYFNDPKLTVDYWNSYGVPAMFYFTSLDTYMKTTGTIMDLVAESPSFPMSEANPFNLATSSRYDEIATGTLMLNKANSNLDQIVPNRPLWVHFGAVAATNPGTTGIRPHNNFITDESKVGANIEVEFPLWGYLYNFCYYDTLEIDISQYAQNYPISRVAVLLSLENALPAEAFAQFYLTDENYNIVDSLIDNPDALVLEAAPIDANGKIIKKIVTQTKIELTPKQIEKLKNCKHILMELHASTDEALSGKLMKIYREYGFKVNVGAEIDVNVDGNIRSIEGVSGKNLIFK